MAGTSPVGPFPHPVFVNGAVSQKGLFASPHVFALADDQQAQQAVNDDAEHAVENHSNR